MNTLEVLTLLLVVFAALTYRSCGMPEENAAYSNAGSGEVRMKR